MHVFSPQAQKDLAVAEASPRTTGKAAAGREVARVMEGCGGERREHGGAGASGRCKRTVSELQVHGGEMGKKIREYKMSTSRELSNTSKLSWEQPSLPCWSQKLQAERFKH